MHVHIRIKTRQAWYEADDLYWAEQNQDVLFIIEFLPVGIVILSEVEFKLCAFIQIKTNKKPLGDVSMQGSNGGMVRNNTFQKLETELGKLSSHPSKALKIQPFYPTLNRKPDNWC